ncbi:MAG: hypothetical protein ACI4V0_01920 [Lachnospiraceae bacterium]
MENNNEQNKKNAKYIMFGLSMGTAIGAAFVPIAGIGCLALGSGIGFLMGTVLYTKDLSGKPKDNQS